MKKSKVVLIPCSSYEEEEVSKAIEKGIGLLGGWASFVREDEKILIKPNLLTRAAPERAVTTHPAVFGAVCASLQKAGRTKLCYGDSSGIRVTKERTIASACGLEELAGRLGVPLADFDEGVETEYPQGIFEKRFILAKGILDCDAVINVCKMKTHMLERITGAVKNIFGAVYGVNKGVFHVKYPNAAEFAKMLTDLNKLVKPALHIMDGVVAMEGNGPGSGTPRHMGVILMSADPVALDSVFCNLVYLDSELVMTNVFSEKYGIGTCKEENIELITPEGVIDFKTAAERYGKKDFDVYRGIESRGNLKYLNFLSPLLKQKPVIDKSLCVGCGVCVDSCPVEGSALLFPKGKNKNAGGEIPEYNYKKCIRCFCCQEMCPKKAISVKRPIAAKLSEVRWKF